jgi:hypothetical protein
MPIAGLVAGANVQMENPDGTASTTEREGPLTRLGILSMAPLVVASRA